MKKGNLVLTLTIALVIPTLAAIYLAQTNPTPSNLMLMLGCGLEDMAFAIVLVINEFSEMYKVGK